MFIHEGGISRRVDVRVKAGEVGPGFSFGVKRFVEVKGNVGDACAHALIVEIQLKYSSTGDTARSINHDVVFEDKLGMEGEGVLTGERPWSYGHWREREGAHGKRRLHALGLGRGLLRGVGGRVVYGESEQGVAQRRAWWVGG